MGTTCHTRGLNLRTHRGLGMESLATITALIQPSQGTITAIPISQVTASRTPMLGTLIPAGLRIRCFRLIAKPLA